jgi:hypothetical protein
MIEGLPHRTKHQKITKEMVYEVTNNSWQTILQIDLHLGKTKEYQIISLRLNQLYKEGTIFKYNLHAGTNYPQQYSRLPKLEENK